jgi:hypothetical protein
MAFAIGIIKRVPTEVVQDSRLICVSAWLTNCSNNLYAKIETYRVYNVIDGKEY